MAQTENNAGAKVIGVLSLVVAGWGVYQLFFKEDKSEKKLSGVEIDPTISGKYNINRYGNNGLEIHSKSGKVLKVFNSKKSDTENWKDAVKWGKKNLKAIRK